MQSFSVGKLFAPEKTSWPNRAEYNYRNGMHILLVTASELSAKEIAAFQSGRIHVALYTEAFPVLFLCYRIEGYCDWSDCSFSIHRVPEEERQTPPAKGPYYTPLTAFLVNADTGILEAIRTVSLSPVFGNRLHAMIQRQLDTPYDPDAEQRGVDNAICLPPAALARRADVVEKAGVTLPS